MYCLVLFAKTDLPKAFVPQSSIVPTKHTLVSHTVALGNMFLYHKLANIDFTQSNKHNVDIKCVLCHWNVSL